MNYLLDTNIISEIIRPVPSSSLVTWLSKQDMNELFISSMTLAEIFEGIMRKPIGRRRRELEAWFDGPEGPKCLFRDRILPFAEKEALRWAILMSDGRLQGRSRSAVDMIIAATAIHHECVIVTANIRHFWGLPWIDPASSVASAEAEALGAKI